MLIVTTPNATSLVNFVLALGRRELAHHDHVSLYSAFTLSNAAERYGWEVLSLIAYAAPPFRRHPGLRSQVARTIGVAVLGLEHQLARYVSPWVADGLILVARPS